MPTTLTQTRATSLSTNSPDFVAVWLFSLLGSCSPPLLYRTCWKMKHSVCCFYLWADIGRVTWQEEGTCFTFGKIEGRMEYLDELSRRELVALKEVRSKGRVVDRALTFQLISDDLVSACPNGQLQLTAKGRRMLLRGSPSLWDFAS